MSCDIIFELWGIYIYMVYIHIQYIYICIYCSPQFKNYVVTLFFNFLDDIYTVYILYIYFFLGGGGEKNDCFLAILMQKVIKLGDKNFG